MRALIGIAVSCLICGAALAQTPSYTPTPPTDVPATMPAPLLTMTAGQTLSLSWNAVTQDTNGNALPAGQALYYDVWEVSASLPPLLVQSGLTAPVRVHADMAAGSYCYVVTATLAQASGVSPAFVTSVGSTPPFCVQVNPVPTGPVTPAAPTGVMGAAS